jgi:phosphopantothenoylcysteine decarboxylase/phosphopantothenate--cysteine ligase
LTLNYANILSIIAKVSVGLMMSSVANQNILLGICGGIAAYKCPEIVRGLRQAGANVRVVMTAGASAFVTPLTLQALSGHPVHQVLLDDQQEAAMSHIELARWADWVLIAPATAQAMAKLAQGFADDLLSTLCLATTSPIVIAPAMNQQMWLNPATQSNLRELENRGVLVIGPAEGEQACGEFGPGRMSEPHEIIEELKLLAGPRLLPDLKVLITAGPTQEPIDPVRFISNHSSGKMGYALAAAAQRAGAKVTLISGPTQLPCPPSVNRISVNTASGMTKDVNERIAAQDILLRAAAVTDYRTNQC